LKAHCQQKETVVLDQFVVQQVFLHVVVLYWLQGLLHFVEFEVEMQDAAVAG
jgi:hypothetical protein